MIISVKRPLHVRIGVLVYIACGIKRSLPHSVKLCPLFVFFVVVCDFGVRMRIGFEGFERVTQRCYTTEMGIVYCIWG